MSGGRPSDYSQATCLAICERLSLGESLRSICRDEAMPDARTVFRWLGIHEEFRQQYARAREALTEFWAEQIIDISDESQDDTIVDDKGNERVNAEFVARSKLRVDTRKWLMARMAPKKYGDRVVNELTGPEGGPIQVDALTTAQRARALAAFVSRTKTDKG